MLRAQYTPTNWYEICHRTGILSNLAVYRTTYRRQSNGLEVEFTPVLYAVLRLYNTYVLVCTTSCSGSMDTAVVR